MPESETTLTRQILRKVRQVEIRSRKHVDEAMAGAYHSVFKGRGIEFEEVREYAPGDDVRTIDWNVTAKMDRPFIKVFEEERELTIMLIVDLSASGDFGSGKRSKRELAAELASVLAFSATRNNDKVGLILFTDRIEKFIAPNKGRKHVLRVIREILFFEPTGKGTDLPGALDRLNINLKRKAIVFVISDFLTRETLSVGRALQKQSKLARALLLANQRHDLICVELSDTREQALPNVGVITIEDAETGELAQIDTSSARVRERYKAWNAKRREALSQFFRSSGIDAFSVQTDQPYVRPLRQFFKSRRARR